MIYLTVLSMSFTTPLVDEVNATFKTTKDNICTENRKYDPEQILCIAKSTYTEMIENGLWTGVPTIKE